MFREWVWLTRSSNFLNEVKDLSPFATCAVS